MPIFMIAVAVACLLSLAGLAAGGLFDPVTQSGYPTAPVTVIPGLTSTPYSPRPYPGRVSPPKRPMSRLPPCPA